MKNVKNLVAKVGFQFDEAIELFSAETLETMEVFQLKGGAITAQPQWQCQIQCHPSCSPPPTTGGGTTPDGGTTPPFSWT